MDLAKAADLVLATIDTFKEFRSDSKCNHIMSKMLLVFMALV